MTTHTHVRRWPAAGPAITLALLCLLVAMPARGQGLDNTVSSPAPFRALFGGAAPVATSNQSLILNAAAFGGYDDDIFARGTNPGTTSPGRPAVSGTFLGTQASLAYVRRLSTTTFSASAATANRYVTDSGDFVTTFAAGSVGVRGTPTARTDYMVQQSVGYRPLYTPVPFTPTSPVGPSLGEIAPPSESFPIDTPDDFTVASDREGIRYSTYGELNRRLTPRSGLQFRGQYSNLDFMSSDLEGQENRRWRAGGAYQYGVTRYLSAQLGYTYRSFNTSADGVAGNHDINVGLVFNRPFRFGTNRTFVTFTTGTTILNRERVSGDGDGRFTIRAIGTANLSHAFSPTWQGNVEYAHSVGYMDGFTEPIEGDRVLASLGGLLTRTLDLSISAGYMSGAIGLQERNFDTGIASARLRFALHARAALFAQYFYYQYSYADGVADLVLPASELQRQGFRAGVNLWLPVLR
jgi:hypothetical protein